jgi:hypothetical protein
MNENDRSHIQNAIGNNNDVAGRDIYKSLNVVLPQNGRTMQRLIEEYKKEKATNVAFNTIIEELDNYLNPIKGEQQVIGLEKKLKDGQFDDFFNYASHVKEIFVKKVDKHRLSKAAQNILLFLLGDVYILFYQKIYPLIISQENHITIMDKIQNDIIDEMRNRLGENVLEIYSDCIAGSIYFLTGNCHIKWSVS